MRASTLVFAALAMAAGRVIAQDPTDTQTADGPDTTDGPDGTTDPTECIMGCATASTVCATTDMTCLCTNQDYQSAVGACVLNTCGADAVDAAAQMQTEMCANDPTESISASASSAVASVTSAASAAASSVRASTSSAARSSASVVSASHSASASASGNAATALKMPSVSYMALGATAVGFVVGPLLLFA
ncbi:hypothetical protein FS837_006166 [Tulasnella sp. UAMH 9824]|nr:hypothetical protein FS837_006166 [Tulasnella sp. UAMH 9824]